ncbi:MAG TPA: hypothetical protein VKM72_19520 [Thermoanaerobaculia bacterium]|nr:hypothetical protein [Thermoanaerobaculia bacterium]
MTAGAPRLLLANLLAEDDLEALAHAGDPRFRRRPPSASTLRVGSQMAGQLAIFSRPGDRLWLPGDHPPEPAAEVLAWCETPQSAALRTALRPSAVPPDLPLAELLWSLPVASPETVAKVHHRGFALRVAEALGCALSGAQMVESLAELDHLLKERDAPAAWVVKAPFSAAGRSRFIEREGPHLADPKSRRTAENLFERHGPLLFEPWLDRIADWGCSALLTPGGLRIVGIHRQRVDTKGQFAGIELDTGDLPDPDRSQLQEVVAGAAAALRRTGYVGPFGIDAWHWRRPDGTVAFHPLGEINARMTFGLVEWAGLDRLKG